MEKQLPKYHETFIPILEVLGDGMIISTAELVKTVRDKFYADLPQELLEEKTKSGDNLLLNRIAWGKSYLKQAEIVAQPERAKVQITEKGTRILKSGHLSAKEIFADVDFRKNQHQKTSEKKIINEGFDENSSPEDMVDIGIDSLENKVKGDLLERLRKIDPYKFENVVAKLFDAMGYGDITVTKKSSDGGIDGIIHQDKFGFEKIYIQAKRYAEDNKIREPLIRDFIGAMSRGTKKGIFVTTSIFDESAVNKAKDAEHTIRLINGRELVDLMYKYNVGVQLKNSYEVKQVDDDFFEEE